METGAPICGSPAANDLTYFVKWFNSTPFSLVTGGSYNLRVWLLDVEHRKIRPTDVNIGQLRRVFTCCTIDDDDSHMYCGTVTGDVGTAGYFPMNAVRWLTPARNLAALVTDAHPKGLTARLYHFGDTPRPEAGAGRHRRRADLGGPAERARFIREHGRAAYLDLDP